MMGKEMDIESINSKIKQVLDYYTSYGMTVYSREFDLRKKIYLEDVMCFCAIFRIPLTVMLGREKKIPKEFLVNLSFVEEAHKSMVNKLKLFRAESGLSLADVVKKLKEDFSTNLSRQGVSDIELGGVFKLNMEILRSLLIIYNKTFDDLLGWEYVEKY
jgi:hypothetical protein